MIILTFCGVFSLCLSLQENEEVASNSDDLEEDEPIESVSPSIVMKTSSSHMSSKLSSSRRPNSPSIVSSGSSQRISPSPSTPQHQQSSKSQHHSRS